MKETSIKGASRGELEGLLAHAVRNGEDVLRVGELPESIAAMLETTPCSRISLQKNGDARREGGSRRSPAERF
jgi:hypothetical protein